MKRLIFLLSVVLILGSCNKKELPVVLPPKGDATLMEVNMGENYEYQLFVSLKEERIVHTSLVDSWDISFQAGRYGKDIYINEAKGMAVHRTNKKSFNQVSLSDTADVAWRQDDPKCLPGGAAVGTWYENADTKQMVYILRMNAAGSEFKKIRFTNVNDEEYLIEVGDIQASHGTEFIVKKDFDKNYVYFDLSLLKEVKDVEPDNSSYDIIFTRYGYTFYDQNPPLPYIVSGVLLNSFETEAAKDSIEPFYEMEGSYCQGLNLSKAQDVIGFDWKEYSVDKNLYVVNQNYNYIIHTQDDEYYKLRFLDFYSSEGMKGYPSFEFHHIL